MKFLLDAHIPASIGRFLADAGHDVIHTGSLPAGNKTTDSEINELSCQERRIVISKDSDFYYSHVLHGKPWKLILVRTGNLNRKDLLGVFVSHLDEIREALSDFTLLELYRSEVRKVKR